MLIQIRGFVGRGDGGDARARCGERPRVIPFRDVARWALRMTGCVELPLQDSHYRLLVFFCTRESEEALPEEVSILWHSLSSVSQGATLAACWVARMRKWRERLASCASQTRNAMEMCTMVGAGRAERLMVHSQRCGARRRRKLSTSRLHQCWRSHAPVRALR